MSNLLAVGAAVVLTVLAFRFSGTPIQCAPPRHLVEVTVFSGEHAECVTAAPKAVAS